MMPGYVLAFKRVMEVDMAYPILVYFITVAMGAMFEFACVFASLGLYTSFLLALGHYLNNKWIRVIAKFLLVVFTAGCFISIFSCKLYFDATYDQFTAPPNV